MKILWDYFLADAEKRLRKKILKSNQLSTYQQAVKRSCYSRSIRLAGEIVSAGASGTTAAVFPSAEELGKCYQSFLNMTPDFWVVKARSRYLYISLAWLCFRRISPAWGQLILQVKFTDEVVLPLVHIISVSETTVE